jgi:hypothetical protein
LYSSSCIDRPVRSSLDTFASETRELGVADAVRGPHVCEMPHATLAPEPPDGFGPREHRTVYSVLGLRVDALPGKSSRARLERRI